MVSGLNHVTGQCWDCWEYDTRIPSWITSSATNRKRSELTESESRRIAAPSRRAGRNTSCAVFETIISPGVDNLLFPHAASNVRSLV